MKKILVIGASGQLRTTGPLRGHSQKITSRIIRVGLSRFFQCLIFLFFMASNVVVGQPGALDNGFGSNGIVLSNISSLSSVAMGILVQPDGQIVAAGTVASNPHSNIGLVRYFPNGSLDNSFGFGGIATTNSSIFLSGGMCLLQSDNKIVVAGNARSGGDNVFALLRFGSDGSLDSSFGTNGQVLTNIISGGASSEDLLAIAIQPDGKIIAAGRTASGDAADMIVARYETDGSLDSSFASNGLFIHAFSPLNDQINAVVVQPDGKILVAGSATAGMDPTDTSNFAVVRLGTDGEIDETFGDNGIVTISVGSGQSLALALVLQPDSKYLVAGFSGYPALATIARCFPDGSLDSSFGTDGVVTTLIGAEAALELGLTLQPDGKILGVADSYDSFGVDHDFAVVRYNSNGDLDSSFGSGGVVLTAIADQSIIPTSLALQPDNKLLVAGYALIGGGSAEFIVVRYLNDLDIGIVEMSAGAEACFVYPNPISESTTLTYRLTAKADVSLRLLDLHGQLVKVILGNVVRGSGEHHETIDLSGLAAGPYFLSLTNGRGTAQIEVIKE